MAGENGTKIIVTTKEATSLESCPKCGYRLMKVPETGLVSCLSSLEFSTCYWHVRVLPWVGREARKDKMTIKEKRMLDLQAEIDRRKLEWIE